MKPKGKHHDTIHSLAEVFANLSLIQKMSVDGFKTGASGFYIDIRNEAEMGMARLRKMEAEIKGEI
jgi:hypothetical protein